MAESGAGGSGSDDPEDPEDEHPIETAIGSIEATAGKETVTIGTLLDAFEDRPLGFVLMVSGVLTAVPVIGGVPGLPAAVAALVVFAVLRRLFRLQGRLPVPGFIRRREVRAATVRAGLARLRPIGKRLDRLGGRRLSILIESWTARTVHACTAAAMAVAMVFLGVVPFLLLPASLAIASLGFALMARDGFVVLVGYAFAGVAVGALGLMAGSVI